MKLEIENKISEIKYIISLLKDHANFEDSKKKLENLEIASQAPDIWDDRIKAEKLFKEKNLLEKQIISINSLETEIIKFYAKKVWGFKVRYCNSMGFLSITNSLFIKKINT